MRLWRSLHLTELRGITHHGKTLVFAGTAEGDSQLSGGAANLMNGKVWVGADRQLWAAKTWFRPYRSFTRFPFRTFTRPTPLPESGRSFK